MRDCFKNVCGGVCGVVVGIVIIAVVVVVVVVVLVENESIRSRGNTSIFHHLTNVECYE